jgi:nucleoside-diphosphate-sugar epimerase
MSIPENKKYLLIGSNSILSKEIILLLKEKNTVVGVFNKKTDNLVKEIEQVSIDNLDHITNDFDAVFIISAFIPSKDSEENKEQLKRVNVDLVKIICEKFKKTKIVLASSVSVYSESLSVINELSERMPATLYGKSKMQGENIVIQQDKYSIVRISSMYGPGMNMQTFMPAIIRYAKENKKIRLFGDGSRQQNYIHVKDVAKIFIQASEQSVNNVYLAVGKVSYSNQAVADIVGKYISGIEIINVGEDNSSSYHYNALNTYNELDFIPEVNIEEGISELIKWQQKKF